MIQVYAPGSAAAASVSGSKNRDTNGLVEPPERYSNTASTAVSDNKCKNNSRSPTGCVSLRRRAAVKKFIVVKATMIIKSVHNGSENPSALAASTAASWPADTQWRLAFCRCCLCAAVVVLVFFGSLCFG